MSEQIKSQVISRRKLFLLVGLAASFAVPAAVLAQLSLLAASGNDFGGVKA